MNPDAPEPAGDAPRPPAYLSRKACEYFGVLRTRIELEGRASSSHTEIIGEAAERMAEIEEASEVIEKDGAYWESYTPTGGKMIRMHPAVSRRSEAMRHLHSLLVELGLTPASLGKVSKPGGKAKPANPFAELG